MASGLNRLQGILHESIKGGRRQAYASNKAVNKDRYIDKGAYLTPHL